MKVRCLVAPLKGGQGIGGLSPEVKAFLFVCFTGLCNFGQSLGQLVCRCCANCVERGLEHGLLTVLQEVQTLGSRLRQTSSCFWQTKQQTLFMFGLVICLHIRSTKSRFFSEFINKPEELALSGVSLVC